LCGLGGAIVQLQLEEAGARVERATLGCCRVADVACPAVWNRKLMKQHRGNMLLLADKFPVKKSLWHAGAFRSLDLLLISIIVDPALFSREPH